ncbi:MAG: AAA family ATPase, partial [Pseudomonadota bacterium]|nr:AAA family ATPase [Pseudomonadota bacterium]
MRLSKVKLSGFKSFVDPTVITFPSNLVGVVGPNGCGKSNVIDAVRWVMGESSASRLRGDSITDVIFKGSSSRKPIGAASVELLFDNSLSTIKGEYSKYNEISIRRAVSRDGISNYYLNGVRCRRKDITGIFLGTGLGPRSYSIIEQGMISRVIEAKPEEMRVFIEEAAGISKYKERRKETSNRIGRTKENLERLLDVIEEVEKQIKNLNRQAKTAERYKKMRQNERRTSADILAIRIRDFNENAEKIEKVFSQKKLKLEAKLADQRKIEAEIENHRAEQSEKNDTFNSIQASYYKIGSEISRLEQSIEYSIEIESRQKKDLEQAIENEKEVENHISLDKEQITDLENSLDELNLNFEQAKNSESTSKSSLQEAAIAINNWQEQWNESIRLENEVLKDQSIALTRMENLEASLMSLNANQAKLDKELFNINLQDIETRITHIEKKKLKSKNIKDNLEKSLSKISDKIIELRESELVLSQDFENKMQSLREREAEQIRLAALQSMSYEDKHEETKQWLKKSGL